MVFNIAFSERASDELASTLEYIENEWSLRISNENTKIFNEKINRIRTNPYYTLLSKIKKLGVV